MQLADLHCHPTNTHPKEALLDVFSRGITSLTRIRADSWIYTYDQAKKLPGVEEIDQGLFAKVTYKDAIGYIVHAQEIMSDHHILALGCQEPIKDFKDAREAIDAIHDLGGLAILPHPFITVTGLPFAKYRYINNKELEKVKELCGMVDEVEVFNAHLINLFPVIAWMKEANDLAKALVRRLPFKGIAASDAHTLLEQVGCSGILLNDEIKDLKSLFSAIRRGDFERVEKPISCASFIKGMNLW
ncbi:MAG: PHP-associated domain-containing protein [Nanoarchaeota archaeon]